MKKRLLLALTICSSYCMATLDNLTIAPLAQHPEMVEQLFELLYQHSIQTLDPDYDAVKKRYMPFLLQHLQEDALPCAFVALLDGVPVGLCCLRKKPVSTDEKCSWFKEHPDTFPWIAGLFVSPAYTNRGIAKALVRQVMMHAKELGFDTLYLFTQKESPEYATYIKHGCREIDTTDFIDDEKTVTLSIMCHESSF